MLGGSAFLTNQPAIKIMEISLEHFHSTELGCHLINKNIISFDRDSSKIQGKYCSTHKVECCKCGWEFGFHYGSESLKLNTKKQYEL